MVAVLIAGYCVHRRKQMAVMEEDRSGEFQNPAFVGDAKLYFEPQPSYSPTHYVQPPHYMTANGPLTVALDTNKQSSHLDEDGYERPDLDNF